MQNMKMNTLPPSSSQATHIKLSAAQIEAIVDDHTEEVRRDMWKTTWKTRFPEVWAGGGLGILVGAAIGALTVASTVLVAPVAVAAALLLPITGAFAVAGMLMGIAGSTDVGSNVGAQLGEMKINQRQRLLDNPEEVLKQNAEYKRLAAERGEFKEHGIPFTKGSKRIYSWKTGLTIAAAGIALGALLVATGGMGILVAAAPSIGAAITGAAGKAAAVALIPKVVACMTIAASAAFGAAFGLDFPTITANTAEFIGKVFSGKIFEHDKKPALENSRTAYIQHAALSEQITPEEATRLNERLATSQDKAFGQTVVQQRLVTSNTLTGV